MRTPPRIKVSNRNAALGRTALSAAVILAGTMAMAEPFDALGQFDGRIGASGADRGPIAAGTVAEISGQGLAPDQPVTLRQNGEALTGGEPVTADAKGNLSTTVTIPETAETEDYDINAATTVRNPYQVAVTEDAIYVTGAVGRPPVSESALAKLDPETLQVLAEVTPPDAPAREDGSDGGVFAVYGVGVAEEAGQVWVTNTRQDTVAVYSTEDLSLIKQFDPGTVGHPRDAVAHDGKVYVSATFEPLVHVFDTETLEELEPIEFESARRGQTFTAASLSLAQEAGKLFVSSLRTDEVAVIDLATDTQTGGFAVENSVNTIGLAASPDGTRLYTVAQGNDAVTIIDAETGEAMRQVNVGANPLNAAVEPSSGDVFIALRGADAVAVISPDGEVLAHLMIGSTPHHLAVDGSGGVYVVKKSGGEDDPTANQVSHITPAD